MADKPALLRARWQTEDGQRRLKALVQAARQGGDWRPILRGFPFADEYRVRNGRDLRYADLSGYDLRNADLQGIHAEKLSLRGANLSGAKFVEADLSFSDMTGSILRESIFTEADCRCAKLTEADLRRAAATRTRFYLADFDMAILINADFTGSDFSHAHAVGADFSETVLVSADFGSATLQGATMLLANARGANFNHSDSSSVVFRDTDLTGANFSFACICGADFTGARTEHACWPPSTSISDVLLVDYDPFCFARDERSGEPYDMATCALSSNYASEHARKRRCECGGSVEVEAHELLYGNGWYEEKCYDRVRCRCLGCGRKMKLLFDVTAVFAKYNDLPESEDDSEDRLDGWWKEAAGGEAEG